MSILPVDERQQRLGYGNDPFAMLRAVNGNGILGKYGSIFKKLQQQAAGQFAEAPEEDQPEQQTRAPIGYGVFAQGLAGALQQGANDPAFGGADVAALQGYAERERAALGQATDADRRYNLIQTLFKNPELAKDPRAIMRLSDTYGIFDPVTSMADAAVARSGDIAGQHKTTAEGLKAAREAGITIDEPSVEQAFANPVTGQTATGYGLFGGNLTPDEQSDRITAEAARTKAEADMIDVRNPLKYNRRSGGSGGNGDGVQSTIVVPIPGVGMATFKGKNQDAVMSAAQGARGQGGQESPRLQNIKRAATQRGYTVQQRKGGGVVLSNGRSSLQYDANGNRVQ